LLGAADPSVLYESDERSGDEVRRVGTLVIDMRDVLDHKIQVMNDLRGLFCPCSPPVG
jgi:hypothetical protein